MDDFIAVSGGFDPVHPGHIAMFDDAATFGKVIVLLNSDEWLKRKKGYVFMSFEERKKVIESFRNVSCVLPAMDNDDSVCESLKNLNGIIHFFGNGGDRRANNTPEAEVCARLNIKIIYGLGGNKIASSSDLVTKAIASGA